LIALQLQAEQTPAPATLVFENREIVTFRAVFAGYTPAQRVKLAIKRMNSIGGTSLYSPVQWKTIPEGAFFFIDDNLLFPVVIADVVIADVEAGTDPKAKAKEVQSRLNEAFRARAQQLSFGFITREILISIGATLLSLLIVKLLLAPRRKVLAALTTATESQSRLIVLRRRTFGLVQVLVRATMVTLILMMIYLWATMKLCSGLFTCPASMRKPRMQQED
jgi:hypothetical protein